MEDEEFDLSEIVNSRVSVRSRFKEIAKHNVNSNKSSNLDNDTYLSDLLKVLKIKSLVIGVGGAGNNTVSRMQDIDSELVETLNINTDAHDIAGLNLIQFGLACAQRGWAKKSDILNCQPISTIRKWVENKRNRKS